MMAATFQMLAEQFRQQRGVIESAAEAYCDFAEEWSEPPQHVVDRVVRRLPAHTT